MGASPAIRVLVLVALGATALWLLVPAVMLMLGLGSYRQDLSEDASSAEPRGDDPDYEKRYRQFHALGFRPVGTTRETVWFMLPLHWRWRSRGTRWLRTSDGMMLASFHRLIDVEPVRFSVMTLNDGGGLVRTTCPGMGMDSEPDLNYGRFELRGVEPEELVERHRANVEAFCRQRGLASKAATFREATDVDGELTRLILVRRRSGAGARAQPSSRSGWGNLVVPLGTVALMIASSYRHRGSAPPPATHAHGRMLDGPMLAVLLSGPVVVLVMFVVVLPLLRRQRILRSHRRDVRD